MWTKQHKKRHLGRLVTPILAAIFFAYFGYHVVNGDLGIEAAKGFEQRRIERLAELEDLIKQRKDLEREVALMSDGSLERDILDEKARYALNVSRIDEIVIFK
ncbi:MAG: septum formation initiator family protein [Rhizobium sp.]|nr:septum formation initiator family protein [Rhizobium sp.]